MKITLSKKLKTKPEAKTLGFGKYFTDHMFTMTYNPEKGWHNAEIVPYNTFKLQPETAVLHYGQGIFEGLKAFKNASHPAAPHPVSFAATPLKERGIAAPLERGMSEITLFRPMDNFARMNRSAVRMCIPEFDVNAAFDGLKKLIEIEKDWIPSEPGTSLYIRPTIIATDEVLGVHPSKNYLFYIILSPVGSYYANGLQPVNIYAEDFYARVALGGTGEAKCMGNYAASLFAQQKAQKLGFTQVLWLDSAEKKYVEEVGAMNIFFVFGNEVVTPALNGSILPGITRDSVIKILNKKGIKITQRKISIDEVVKACGEGKLTEMFGTGTAAVVSPVGMLRYKEKDYIINNKVMGDITKMLYDTVTGIQTQKIKDEFGFVVRL